MGGGRHVEWSEKTKNKCSQSLTARLVRCSKMRVSESYGGRLYRWREEYYEMKGHERSVDGAI